MPSHAEIRATKALKIVKERAADWQTLGQVCGNRESIINSKVLNNIYTNVLGTDSTAAGYSIVGSHDSKRDIARPLHATSSGSISATKPKTENQNENGKLTGVAFGKSGEDQPQKCAP